MTTVLVIIFLLVSVNLFKQVKFINNYGKRENYTQTW